MFLKLQLMGKKQNIGIKKVYSFLINGIVLLDRFFTRIQHTLLEITNV